MTVSIAYKVTTNDLRPPVQGGHCGLDIAIPTGPKELGWTLDPVADGGQSG